MKRRAVANREDRIANGEGKAARAPISAPPLPQSEILTQAAFHSCSHGKPWFTEATRPAGTSAPDGARGANPRRKRRRFTSVGHTRPSKSAIRNPQSTISSIRHSAFRIPHFLCALCVLCGSVSLASAQEIAPIAPVVAPEMPALPVAPTIGDSGDADPVPGPMALPSIDQVAQALEGATKKDGQETEWSSPIRLAMVFTGLALLPSLLVMMTSFTRIVIVLAFIRRALTTQNIPPTIAIIGLALFLTLFTMAPTFGLINEQALQPYLAEKVTFQEACGRGNAILKNFMLSQTREADLSLFVDLSHIPEPETAEDVPSYVAIPSFAISEFRTAFEMGCLLFIPFLLIDLVTAGILLATGMMMLPPSMISMPFKIILFVLVDGWRLLAETLVISFQGVG